MDVRQTAINSDAKVRLITGKPGVGKTYFGCQVTDHELRNPALGVSRYQKVLFLTFARNAVARIRQAYNQQLSKDTTIPERIKEKRISEFNARVHLNTFAGFFWWLITSYGRYLSGDSATSRPWFIGAKRSETESVPDGYKGYTFEELEDDAIAALRIKEILSLISDIYPLIIIDEFQDVDKTLFEFIDLLRQNSRLVLLSGPGQCIYRGLKEFDPDEIMNECKTKFNPVAFELEPLDEDSHRYCPEIAAFIKEYESGDVSMHTNWPIMHKGIDRKTRGGFPKELETQVGLLLKSMRDYLSEKSPQRKSSLCVLTSTNQGASKIYSRLLRGNETYHLNPLRVSLHFEDTLLSQYGRLILTLLKNHWIAIPGSGTDIDFVSEKIASFFKQADKNDDHVPSDWVPLSNALLEIVCRQKGPTKDKTKEGLISKLVNDIRVINKKLRAKKGDLPNGSPKTPLIETDTPLMNTLCKELLLSIESAFYRKGHLNIAKAEILFEKSMQQRIIFEKLGIESGIQVMTIHKAKGREFDGVVIVMEDSHKAMWRNNSNASDSELNDLYRVETSRAKEAFGLIGYNDIYHDAKPYVQKFLPTDIFKK